jgi:hypothetical protein
MGDTTAALCMLDSFTSVGAGSFHVTKTDLNQQVIWGKPYQADELRRLMPAMVRTACIRRPIRTPDGDTVMAGENLIIRPSGQGVAFVQLDDLSAGQLGRLSPAVFIIHATSPGSYQAWIAVSVPDGKEAFKDFMRRVRRAVGGNDKSASHATRVAGTENFKTKYVPDYPTVTITETHPGRVVTPEQLQALGLLAPAESVSAPPLKFLRAARTRSGKARQWPSYEMALAGAPANKEGSGPSRSHADFWWCYLALQWGWTSEETEAKLLEVSEKARQRERMGDLGYIRETLENAAAWLERGRQRSRG